MKPCFQSGLLFSCLVLLMFGSAPKCSADDTVYPQGTVALASPEILWRVAAPRGSVISRTSMTLDGEKVTPVYRSLRRALVYQPSRPLASGTHSVTCRLQLDTGETVRKSWSFAVADDALPFLPSPNAKQRTLLAEANAYRRLMGLPDFALNAALCAAAQGHSQYAAINEGEGHFETAGKSGFRGKSPWQRAQAWGYSAGASEDIAWGNPEEAISQLIGGPYHRLPFMEPGAPDFGAGYEPMGTPTTGVTLSGKWRRGVTTLNFHGKGGKGIVVYPVPDQTDVPLTFDGGETPNPLRLHTTKAKSGYIITLAAWGMRETLRFVRADLTQTDGEAVPFWINAPHNDSHLKNAIFVIPQKPLQPATTYQVKIVFAFGDDFPTERVWKFTTQENTGRPKRLAFAVPDLDAKNLLPTLPKAAASQEKIGTSGRETAGVSSAQNEEHSPEERELLELLNDFRKRADNLPALKFHPALRAAAQRHANDMAENGVTGHRGFDLSEVRDRVREAGYPAETSTQQIVNGRRYTFPQSVLDALVPLPLNRRSLLDSQWMECGIAHRTFTNARGDTVHVWVLVFGKPRPKE
jgi:uncharacterized protein YkwD